MTLILRYIALFFLSLALPLFLLTSNGAMPGGMLDLTIRSLMIPIYCCLAVFLMTSLRPAQMRKRLLQTRNRIDDLHLWLAPVMVMLAFMWAGLMLLAILASGNVHENHPFFFLGLFLGAAALAIWIAIRVRRAFFKAD